MERIVSANTYNACLAIGQTRGGKEIRRGLYLVPTLAGWIGLRCVADYGEDSPPEHYSAIKAQTIQDILDWMD
jgi:hypothetical protein